MAELDSLHSALQAVQQAVEAVQLSVQEIKSSGQFQSDVKSANIGSGIENFREDVGAAEALRASLGVDKDLFTLNKKALFADEKYVALQSQLADLELKRIQIKNAEQSLAHDRALKNAELETLKDERIHKATMLSDERKYGSAKWTQELRHADIAIENQWPDSPATDFESE